MDMSEVAGKMLEWEKLNTEIKAIEGEISVAVLEHGKTINVGNVRATYSKPRKKNDHEGTAKNHPMVSEATISLFTTQPPQPPPFIDWKKICEHVGAEVEFTLTGKPSVKVKII